MCSHYRPVSDTDRFFRTFAVQLPLGGRTGDMWPKYEGVFVRRPPEFESGDEAVPEKEAVTGRWGLVPSRTRAINEKLSTFNARSETADKSFTFSGAWHQRQQCIVPAACVYEPDWSSGKAVPTQILHKDGEPLAVAGLWDRWRGPGGQVLESFTMLTMNAQKHELFSQFHRPGQEKRMVVLLPAGTFDEWLHAKPEEYRDFFQPYPADRLVARASQKGA